MQYCKLYHIRVTRNDDRDPTEHVYFQGDDFCIDNAKSFEIYDCDNGILKIFEGFPDQGDTKWLRI